MMPPGGHQPYRFSLGNPNQPGLSLAAMLRGKPFFLGNPIQQRRDGQQLARILLTGRYPHS